MDVILSKKQSRWNVEIRLAANHSIFLQPETARKLAEDIMAVLQAHDLDLQQETEVQENLSTLDSSSISRPKLTVSPYQVVG